MAKADKSTTNFETMGTSMSQPVAAVPSAHTTLVPKGHAKDGSGDPATAAIRPHVHERNGFKGAPQVGHSYPTAPEAAGTLRNVRYFRSAVGNRDFYARRQHGQTS